MASQDTTSNQVLYRVAGTPDFQDRCYRRFLAAAMSVMTETVQATTSGTTAAANANLVFASQPVGIAVGWSVRSLTNPAAIPSTALVKTLGATVGMSAGAAAAIAIGDIILFSPPDHAARAAFAGALFAQNINRQVLATIILANASNQTKCLADPSLPGGEITDSDIDFTINSDFTGIATARGW